MNQPEGSRYSVRTEAVIVDEDLNLTRAGSAARMMLSIWRTRFVSGPEGGEVTAEYGKEETGRTKIVSERPEVVTVTRQDPGGVKTTYEFDSEAGQLKVEVEAPDHRRLETPGNPVFLFEDLTRYLLDADEQESEGR